MERRLPLPIRRHHDSPFPLYTIRLPYRSASFTVFTFSKISSSRNSNPSKIAPFILPFLAYAFLFSETPSSFRSDDIKISAISFIIYPFPPSYVYIRMFQQNSFPSQSKATKESTSVSVTNDLLHPCTLLFHLFSFIFIHRPSYSPSFYFSRFSRVSSFLSPSGYLPYDLPAARATPSLHT